ncbi:hypothetical protein EV198_0607 [Roseivirga ehrenbergii]|uniref:Uncharacterized protein n=1 Tax=Roseivirga ehrenbergii (strain DSM 102268 / JCM 13514 / KCTC 12282 / NCIMB 14502 / KMM 6017) TaxID=279360 RepID=A0A150X827_ROSEK|nr:hypothetical protein [Roseivirga ehrenbergii]KYG74885.1 hypothetical protein MB14_06695 [Roseivirga ehrenbergii]TCL13776.1 hypothetical protein EV198_0607 [Roseivirga ehrenbergii]
MLTIEKIKIYNKYGGDIDGFSRGGKTSEQNLFGDNNWSLIDEFEQDVKLISDRLVSKEYREKSLIKLNENCDLETKDYFNSKISFYSDFKEVSEIMANIKSRINDETDTVWAGFDNTEVLIKELDSDQKQIELLDFDTLEKIMVEFLPTSTYQELAMSNGWSDEYLQIAEKFDSIHKRIKEKLFKTTYKNNNGSSAKAKDSNNNKFWSKLKSLWS